MRTLCLGRPGTEARIRAFRVSGIDSPIFWLSANPNDN
jgi:hypothetical protein